MEKRRVLGEEVMEWGKRKMKREVFKENRGEVCHGVTIVLIIVISFFNSSHLTHLVSQFLMLSSPIALLPSNGSFYEENKKNKNIIIGAGLGSDPWAWDWAWDCSSQFERLLVTTV